LKDLKSIFVAIRKPGTSFSPAGLTPGRISSI